LWGVGVFLGWIIVAVAVVTGITYHIAINVFLAGIILVDTVVQAVGNTVTIKVRSAAGIGYFITEQGRTGITAMDRTASATAGVCTIAVEAITAVHGIIGMHAAGGRVAGISGADVAVITIESRTCYAGPIGTGICYGTGVTVIAGIGIGIV
jgi:hypothetical protein